ncbi:hypothetical protein M758_9G106900 [Ceratodon purpureus]|nr:hypothetical protein M758_9G106900 [Ceratodon purpureus]
MSGGLHGTVMLYRCDSFLIVVLLTLEFASFRKLNLDRCCVIIVNDELLEGHHYSERTGFTKNQCSTDAVQLLSTSTFIKFEV